MSVLLLGKSAWPQGFTLRQAAGDGKGAINHGWWLRAEASLAKMDAVPLNDKLSSIDESQTTARRGRHDAPTRVSTPMPPSPGSLPCELRSPSDVIHSPSHNASLSVVQASSSTLPQLPWDAAVPRSPRRDLCDLSVRERRGKVLEARLHRKREREKQRRASTNAKFDDLSSCLVISAASRCDREAILEAAIEHIKRQAAQIKKLEQSVAEHKCMTPLRSDESIRGLKKQLKRMQNRECTQRNEIKELDLMYQKKTKEWQQRELLHSDRLKRIIDSLSAAYTEFAEPGRRKRRRTGEICGSG